MKPLRGLALATGLLAAGTPVRAQTEEVVGPPKPVVVANTAAQAVPVTGTVTGTVNIGNTPDVRVANTPNVNVANTASVVVTNTPTVTIGNAPTVNAQQAGPWTVSVQEGILQAVQSGNWSVGINPNANGVRLETETPIPVRNVDTAAPETFHFDLSSESWEQQAFRVPSNRRAVIEHVTMQYIASTTGDRISHLPYLETTLNSRRARHFLNASRQTYQAHDWSHSFTVSQPARFYADADSEVRIGYNGTIPVEDQWVNTYWFASVTGYLMPVP